MPLEIDGPEIDEVEPALDGTFFQSFQFFGRNLGKRRQEFGQL